VLPRMLWNSEIELLDMARSSRLSLPHSLWPISEPDCIKFLKLSIDPMLAAQCNRFVSREAIALMLPPHYTRISVIHDCLLAAAKCSGVSPLLSMTSTDPTDLILRHSLLRI